MIKFIFDSNYPIEKLAQAGNILTNQEAILAVCERDSLPYVHTLEDLLSLDKLSREQILINAMRMNDDRVAINSARKELSLGAMSEIIATAALTDYDVVIQILVNKAIGNWEASEESVEINSFMLSAFKGNQFMLYDSLIRGHYHFARTLIKSGIPVDEGAFQIALNRNAIEEIIDFSRIANAEDIELCVRKNLYRSLLILLQRGALQGKGALLLAITTGFYRNVEVLLLFGAVSQVQYVDVAIERGLSDIALLLARSI